VREKGGGEADIIKTWQGKVEPHEKIRSKLHQDHKTGKKAGVEGCPLRGLERVGH